MSWTKFKLVPTCKLLSKFYKVREDRNSNMKNDLNTWDIGNGYQLLF